MTLLVIGRESRRLIGEVSPRPKMPEYSQSRRAKLKELKICINGRMPGAGKYGRPTIEHGPVVSAAGRCKWCCDVHKHGKLYAIRMRDNPVPP